MSSSLSCLFLTAMLFVAPFFGNGYLSLEDAERHNLPEHMVCMVENVQGVPAAISIGYTDGFWVDGDETVYLLEPYKNRVVYVKKNNMPGIITLDGCILASDVVCTKQQIYIYDDLLSAVRVYNKRGVFLFQSDISLEQDYVKKLAVTEEGAVIVTYGGKQILINASDGSQTIKESTEVTGIRLDGFDYTEYVDTSADGTVYVVATRLIPDSSVIAGELVLCKLSPKGELLDSYILPTEEMLYLPDTYLQVTEKGKVYLLVIGEDGIQVQRILWTREEPSVIETVKDETKEVESDYKKISQKQEYRNFSPTVDRAEAWERAQEICSYPWTLRKSNTRVSKSEPGVELPREIEAVRKANEGNASWKATMYGIPYCWGGFDTPYGGIHGKSFRNLIENNGYVAGNITTTGYLKYYTAGLDCSGFVSAVLGAEKKMGTNALLGFGSEIRDYKQLKSMDMFVSPGDHVIMFCEWLEDGIMLVTESSKRESKTMIHPKSMNEFVVSGFYQMRSPW